MQKTAYEMRISDWSSDVCSSDLGSLDIPSIDIGDVADRFEGIERNADRQDHMRECERLHAHRLQHFIETADAEVRVFEIRQRRQIDDAAGNQPAPGDDGRSEARRLGNECVSTCGSRW